jgi:hypothetical protein
MEHAQQLADQHPAGQDKGAATTAAPLSDPLALVTAAIAGGDLPSVAAAAAVALGRPIAIAIPALGEPVASPPGGIDSEALAALDGCAREALRGNEHSTPPMFAGSVQVRIGEETVGVVAALNGAPAMLDAGELAWLEATAAAAAVATRLRETGDAGLAGARRAFVESIRDGSDNATVLAQAGRLGYDPAASAVALCALGECDPARLAELHAAGAVIAELAPGRTFGLVPAGTKAPDALAPIVGISAPRRGSGQLRHALREAEVLAELTAVPAAAVNGQEETYRLLIGVLLRDPDELARLKTQTVSPLERYDERNDTELVVTLRAFLAHDGSTTETAEALSLHRHTVGYRLSRVHEVSGLSPYESDGRERLSLGLKAHHILAVWQALQSA